MITQSCSDYCQNRKSFINIIKYTRSNCFFKIQSRNNANTVDFSTFLLASLLQTKK